MNAPSCQGGRAANTGSPDSRGNLVWAQSPQVAGRRAAGLGLLSRAVRQVAGGRST